MIFIILFYQMGQQGHMGRLAISQGYATRGNKTNIKVMFSPQGPQLHYQQMFALQSILAVNKEQNTHRLHFKPISILFML